MNIEDLRVTIGGVTFGHPIMGGAGWCKNQEHVDELVISTSSAVIVGSITKEFRLGNEAPNYDSNPERTLNSFGMPNLGMESYLYTFDEWRKSAHSAEEPKVLIANVAGFNADEYAELASRFSSKCDVVELNLGCPNVWGEDKKQEPIPSFHPEIIEKILSRLTDQFSGDPKSSDRSRFWVKLSPYSDPGMIEEVAKVIGQFDIVDAICTSNTFPMGFATDKGKQVLKNKFAGMSGPPLLAMGPGIVAKFRECLPDRISIIGIGGIENGEHVVRYMDAGAVAVQVTSALMKNGPQAIATIVREYFELLEA
ncbi:MAG TPA: hypothetical protein VHQ20_02915 [Patescibacteria group bacterium]|jgi:dihydroorotate dehydrogenase|nr:hypothetical protein [Patescibacteria group bacterium]